MSVSGDSNERAFGKDFLYLKSKPRLKLDTSKQQNITESMGEHVYSHAQIDFVQIAVCAARAVSCKMESINWNDELEQ